MDVTGVPLNSFHVIGISAGAHAAGSVGFNFNQLFNYKLQLPRITGVLLLIFLRIFFFKF